MFLAGVSATLAVGMKQNLVSAVVFVAVLVTARVAVSGGRDDEHGARRRRALLTLVAAVTGGVVPLLVLLGWGASVGVTLR